MSFMFFVNAFDTVKSYLALFHTAILVIYPDPSSIPFYYLFSPNTVSQWLCSLLFLDIWIVTSMSQLLGSPDFLFLMKTETCFAEPLMFLIFRSYELMELILKVYIYREGSKPIFHVPHLNGIYASEGWFMRFMESNKQFVTRDPEKAHLFYLPYSMRQLELKLYVPGSHQIKPLAIFLRDYVNMIAGKYPFWNRTHGSDHFLVACHDWVSNPWSLLVPCYSPMKIEEYQIPDGLLYCFVCLWQFCVDWSNWSRKLKYNLLFVSFIAFVPWN